MPWWTGILRWTAIFTPNPQRLEHIQEMATAYNAQGVIHYGLQFCQPYLMESIPVEKALEEKTSPACGWIPITAWRMPVSSKSEWKHLSGSYEALPFYIYYISSQYADAAELMSGYGAAIILLGVCAILFLLAFIIKRHLAGYTGSEPGRF